MPVPRFVLTVTTSTGEKRYINACPHTGVPLAPPGETPLSRDGLHLVCTLHGALFRIEDGYCIAGPCEGQSLQPADG